MIFFPIICASLFIALPRIISAVPVSADPDSADPVSGDDGYINNPSSGETERKREESDYNYAGHEEYIYNPSSGEREKGCSFLYFPSGWSSRKRYEVFYNKGSSDPWMHDQGTVHEDENQYLILWQQARGTCQSLGGDLAKPTDWEQELKILAGISKLPNGKYCKYCKYWIGIEKKTADAFWVSGEKMELDGSELKFASDSQWGNKTQQNMCGAIDPFGINDVHCDDGLVGYVCEFTNEAPTCMDNLMANENPQ